MENFSIFIPDNDSEWFEYIPFSKNIKMNELRFSTKVMIINFPDAEYFGEILNGKRDGQGIIRYKSGRIYEGYWKNGLRHGEGSEIFSNKNRFEGTYLNGKPEGNGVYYWKTGEIYEGSWKNGLKHGNGIFKGVNNECYIGEWKNSKPDGRGVHTWSDGDKYEWEFLEGLKHGNGTDLYSNGDVLIGRFRFGKPYGIARYIWKDGSNYTGNFEDGKKHGYGRWHQSLNKNGNSYEGYYKNDKKHGYGVYRWKSGNEYKGQFAEDERHGLGQMRWRDGTIYLGQWEKGIQHGYGKITFSNGEIKEGIFNDNNYIGPAISNQVPEVLKNKGFNIESLNPMKFPSFANTPFIEPKKKVIPITSRNLDDKSFTLSGNNVLASFEINRSYRNKYNDTSGKNLLNNSKRIKGRNIYSKSPYGRDITKLKKRRLINVLYKKINKNGVWIPPGIVKYSSSKERLLVLNKKLKKRHYKF